MGPWSTLTPASVNSYVHAATYLRTQHTGSHVLWGPQYCALTTTTLHQELLATLASSFASPSCCHPGRSGHQNGVSWLAGSDLHTGRMWPASASACSYPCPCLCLSCLYLSSTQVIHTPLMHTHWQSSERTPGVVLLVPATAGKGFSSAA